MRVFVVFLMVLVASIAQTQDSDMVVDEQELPRVLCGRNLAKARMLYCDSDTQKRFSEDPLAGSMYPRSPRWWSRLVQRSKKAHGLRGKRNPGIVDECCYKPCYLSELLNYC